ncbi:MAG: Smr/MutS family protein [Desulfobacterales bacterium]
MKASKSSGINTPFENLKSLLKSGSVPLHSFPAEKIFLSKKFKHESDDVLFARAMEDVLPLDKKNIFEFEVRQKTAEPLDQPNTCHDPLTALRKLVAHGEGFVVENTSEYMEGSGPDVCREVVRRLHQGDFSIQAFIDLHGLGVVEAQEVFETFLKESVATGKKGILIVHGRGLSSPNEPVLKMRVYHWLTRGPWRKWILAFSSARSCDGGAGATVVLLRDRPATKRQRKKKSSKHKLISSPEKKHAQYDRSSQRSGPQSKQKSG